MVKSLIKNLICFTLMCAIILTVGVALYASTSTYFGTIMVATLSAEKHLFTGDTFSAYTRDDLNEHSCSLSYDEDPPYNALIRMTVLCYIDVGDTNSDGINEYEIKTYYYSERTSYCTYSENMGFGNDLDHVTSEHRLYLYCEGKSEVHTLHAYAQ